MKKLFANICTILLCLSLVACGNDEKPDTTNNPTESSVTESTTKNESASEKEDKKENNTEDDKSAELPNTYKVPLKNVYIDVPNYQEIEEGYTELFIVHESKYVAITSDTDATAENAKDAHALMFDMFKINMQNYEGGVKDITIEKEEIKEINGVEVYAFEGKIHYGTDNIYKDCAKGEAKGYAKGYSFIMDGVPCEIIGSVIDESQQQELIDEISTVVDEMIKTARETA